ncbi:traB domain-containing protein isoform X2 [Callorhinchus milii]|uniref:TraB domain-containing protein-like n=1 Tax=Callorhinchus milii TaxID=7868 RepID=V9KQW9_CALMI|nr:traB domain-containing protein isoform X2 [Callorhinchus milii]|eukprot:gi/632947640/ref/XP_007889149.1/ PREDICTED: traB domain-containing protein-like isoform X2 [Callorhinchus milii]
MLRNQHNKGYRILSGRKKRKKTRQRWSASDTFKQITYVEVFDLLWAVKIWKRKMIPKLPKSVTELVTEEGCKVYLVGTAHVSKKSIRDVKQTIQQLQPDSVILELCNSRVSLLHWDEQKLMEAMETVNLQLLLRKIKEVGVKVGLLEFLFIMGVNFVVEELGMFPGGEMRAAFKEAKKVPFCKLHLADRPIFITFKRIVAGLSLQEIAKLGFGFMSLFFIITKNRWDSQQNSTGTQKKLLKKEFVEKLKQRDVLEELKKSISKHLPSFYHTLITERDIYLTHMLRQAAKPIERPQTSISESTVFVPSVIVGVVGMCHVSGIEKNWNNELNIQEIMSVPAPSFLSKTLGVVIRAAWFGLMCYGIYQLGTWVHHFMPSCSIFH